MRLGNVFLAAALGMGCEAGACGSRDAASPPSPASTAPSSPTGSAPLDAGDGAAPEKKGTAMPGSNAVPESLLTRGITVSKSENRFLLHIDVDLMVALMPVFESVHSYSNGPAWAALVEFLSAGDSTLRGLEIDDESDAAFVHSSDRAPLDALRQRLVTLARDPSALRSAILAGRAKGFGHGDL
jgi:hypothetical protein